MDRELDSSGPQHENAQDNYEELESLIKLISEHIGLAWSFLARSLGFSQTDIDAIINRDKYDLKEQIYQFFNEWKRRDGREATRDRLYAAAVDASLEKVLEAMEKISESSPPPMESPPTPPPVESSPTRSPLGSPPTCSPLGSPPTRSPLGSPPTRSPVGSPPTRSPLGSPPTCSPQASPQASPRHTPPPAFRPPTPPSVATPPLQSTPLDPEVMRDSTGTTTEHSPISQISPNSQNFAPTRCDENDLNIDEAEYVRRKRLERFASNLSNNSALSDSSNSDVQRQPSLSSVPDTPPPTLTNSLQQVPEQHPPSQPRPLVCRFELNDVVMVKRPDAAPWYGVVRWIGERLERPGEPVAGIEMEDEVPGGGDGSMNGERHFVCQDKHGLFLPVALIKKDDRFSDSPTAQGANSDENTPASNFSSNESASSSFPSVEEMLKRRLFPNGPMPNLQTNTDSDVEKVLVFTVPADHAGLVIGREGRNIQEVERLTNTTIKMERDYFGGLSGVKRGVIRGSEENQKKALQLILNRLKKRVDLHTAKTETIQIPEDKVGLVIGRGGQTINAIKSLAGVVDIKIDDRIPGLASFSIFASSTRTCTITGSEKDIEKAKQLIDLAAKGGNIVVGATLAALIADLATLGVNVEESN